jgi:hypothetical protein
MLARLRPYILLFVALTIIYHANLRPVDSGDTLPGSLIPFAVILDRTITLDRFAPWLLGHVWYAGSAMHKSHGHYFSSYPIGGPLLVSPLYVPLAFLVRHWDAESLVIAARIGGKCAAAAVTALSAVLLLLLLKRITTARWAWFLTFIYALATTTWSISSQALWQHGPAELVIVGAFLCLELWTQNRQAERWLWLCGLCAAAAFIIRPTSLVLLPAIVAAALVAKAALAQHIRLLAAPLLGGLLLAGYNYYVFDHVSGGYAVGLLSGSVVAGLAGVFVSPGRGLLIYTPVALFALFAFAPAASAARRRYQPLLAAAVVFILLDSYAIASSVIWWGGYCWGPRMLTELVSPLVVLMAIGVPAFDRPWPRRAFAALAVYSFLNQAVGAFFYPKGHWDAGPISVDAAPARLWDWRDNPMARTVRGGLYWEPYAIVGAAITGGIPAAQRRLRELNVNPFEEAQPGKVPRKLSPEGRRLP